MENFLALFAILVLTAVVVFVVRQKKAAKKKGISTLERIKEVVKEL
jgi:hypothetical protein